MKGSVVVLSLALIGCVGCPRDPTVGAKLHKAIFAGDLDTVKALLDRGVSPNTTWYDGTALHVAVHLEHKEIAELLIDRGANVNGNRGGVTPLAWTSNRDVALLLLGEGAIVNLVSSKGKSLLDYAQEDGDKAIAEVLREHGAKTAKELAQNEPLNERLRSAMEHDSVPAARQALDDGADPDYVLDPLGRYLRSVLAEAIVQKRRGVACLLIERGADIRMRCGGGMTSLHYVCRFGGMEIAERLLAEGADVNAPSPRGTPLDVAERRGHKEIADLVRKHGGKASEELRREAQKRDKGED